jgi:hypothetical protein
MNETPDKKPLDELNVIKKVQALLAPLSDRTRTRALNYLNDWSLELGFKAVDARCQSFATEIAKRDYEF